MKECPKKEKRLPWCVTFLNLILKFEICLAHPVTQLLPLICYFDQPAYDLIPPAAAPTPSFLT